jgi:hypothetical protein
VKNGSFAATLVIDRKLADPGPAPGFSLAAIRYPLVRWLPFQRIA